MAITIPAGRAPIMPLIITGIGLYLAWFSVHYWGSDTKWPTDPVKDVLQGKGIPAATGQTTAVQIADQVEGASAGSTPGYSSSVTGAAIVNDALKYVGDGYVYGGPSSPGQWDCSSFCSYVLGHDLGMPIPGGDWATLTGNGTEHGPTTNNYLLFGTAIQYGSEQPGDLVVTSVHMGIVIGGGQMVSAEDQQLGTGIGSYQSGFPGGTPYVRRVTSTVAAASANAVSGQTLQALGDLHTAAGPHE